MQAYLVRRCCQSTKLDREPALKAFLIEKLQIGWFPDLIAGRLKREYGYTKISRESIYRYIYSPKVLPLKLYRYLQEQRRSRQTFGHWEGDLVHFRHTKTNLLNLIERKSRFILAIKNASRQPKPC